MANLAQQAASAIGADALLTRLEDSQLSGGWNQRQAREWWQAHEDVAEYTSGHVSATGRTQLAVDMGGREPGAEQEAG